MRCAHLEQVHRQEAHVVDDVTHCGQPAGHLWVHARAHGHEHKVFADDWYGLQMRQNCVYLVLCPGVVL